MSLKLAILTVSALGPTAGMPGGSKVEVVQTAQGWRLLRNSEPYFIKGVGGRHLLEQLQAAGGNSIRTWHAGEMQTTLDRAHALGLTVTFGIWMKHERHGFDYSDAARVAAQKAKVRDIVLMYKDHPALLMWGIGNEVEGDGSNPLVWKAINDIARMIKELDSNHPTMTVIAGVWPNKIREFNTHCPDVDVVGINAYGKLKDVPQEARRQGLKRPYVVTEFGPTGWWEVDKTSWGVALEPTSTQKAETYRRGYREAVIDQPGLCLGSYAFLWGDKQEHTRTWFGLFLPEGQRTAAIDVLTREWTGKWPANRCPEIQSVNLKQSDGEMKPVREHQAAAGARLEWSVTATDPDGDPLSVSWELREESTDKKTGGDREQAPPEIPAAVTATDGTTMILQTPDRPGAYRVFVYLLDGQGNAATANVPLLVR